MLRSLGWQVAIQTQGPFMPMRLSSAALFLLTLVAAASPVAQAAGPHVMPKTAVRPLGAPPPAAPAGAHLTYYGGRIGPHIQVIQVLWGTGSYLPQVTSTATPSVASFYNAVLQGNTWDWLAEYNTPASGGTNQQYTRGNFVRQITITPSTSATTLSDATIQAELQAQIQAGHLPAPTVDSAGNPTTYYALFFPHGRTITQGTQTSCVAGGFCAYHGTVLSRVLGEFYYAVQPDMQAGSGCDTGCGSGTPFANVTSVASHELAETITDPEIGLATVYGPPLAWYDAANGEIGDICNAQDSTFTGIDGQTYGIQTEFSNVTGSCIVTRAAPVPPGSTATGSSTTSTDGPLPPWALTGLGAALLAVAGRRLRNR